MAYVPKPLNPEWTGWDIPETGGTPPSLTVYATKRFVGFGPWPDPPKRKRKKKRKKKA